MSTHNDDPPLWFYFFCFALAGAAFYGALFLAVLVVRAAWRS